MTTHFVRALRGVVFILSVLQLSCGANADCVSPLPPARTMVLEDVTLLDGNGGGPRPGMSIVITEGTITQMERTGSVEIESGWRVHRLSEQFVLPGLIDTHAHVTFFRDRDTFSGYDQATSERILKILLAHGITTVLDPAASARAAVELRDAILAGRVLGPRMLTAGRPINWGPERTEEDVRAEVNRQASAGIDYVKVYAKMPPHLIHAAAEAAHAHGLRVVGHLYASSPEEAVAAGIDAITHAATWAPGLLPHEWQAAYLDRRQERGSTRARIDWLNWLDLDGPEIQRSILAVAGAGTPLDPTLIASVTKFRGRDPRYRKSRHLNVVPREVVSTWEGALSSWTDEDFERAAIVWPQLVELVKRYYDAGVLLTTGTDFPSPFVIPGAGLHDEMELFVQAGISPDEVIRIATRNGAESLGLLGETGTVAVGKRADLIVLDADPTTDIDNIRRVERVFLAGKEHSPCELLRQARVGNRPG